MALDTLSRLWDNQREETIRKALLARKNEAAPDLPDAGGAARLRFQVQPPASLSRIPE
ncbi:hypothetical protein [Thiohalorhabdus methylotrophus]|uniref:Uncharacterized protein n=1 Tax=Thiohalorhabdus methylotrophus TaxID=3242694 RepID=A0ABV4TQ13_9GAMM